MRGVVLITLACIGMASSLMMPSQVSFLRACFGSKVYPELSMEWSKAQPVWKVVVYSKNVQYFTLSNLLGAEAVRSLSEEDAAGMCVSVRWSDQMTATLGFTTDGEKNSEWVIHRNPYRPGTSDVTIKGQYAYSSVITLSDNESFVVCEMAFPDGTNGFVVSISQNAVMTPEKIEMVKMKLADMGYKEDQYISVCKQCAPENMA